MRRGARGFTLVEAVIVIAIAGVVSAMVAVFIKRPIEGYFDATRRAELTDAADTALRRLSRDLRLALPNSIRVDPTGRFIEFLITTGGGRYRAEVTSTGTGNPLDFVTAAGDTSFDVIGTMPTIAAGSQIVVFNLGAGFSGSDAWQASSNNRATVANATATSVTLTAAKLFPLESPASWVHPPVGWPLRPGALVHPLRCAQRVQTASRRSHRPGRPWAWTSPAGPPDQAGP